MVSQVDSNWQCDDCKLLFKDKEWAEKCEAWCIEHGSCNLEICKHRLK